MLVYRNLDFKQNTKHMGLIIETSESGTWTAALSRSTELCLDCLHLQNQPACKPLDLTVRFSCGKQWGSGLYYCVLPFLNAWQHVNEKGGDFLSSFKILRVLTGCHYNQACLDSKCETGTCLANSVGWEGPVHAAVRWFCHFKPQIWSSRLGPCVQLLPFGSFILDRSIKSKWIIFSKPGDQNRDLNTIRCWHWW